MINLDHGTYLSIVHHVNALHNDMLREFLQEVQNIFHLDCVWQTPQTNAILGWTASYDVLCPKKKQKSSVLRLKMIAIWLN